MSPPLSSELTGYLTAFDQARWEQDQPAMLAALAKLETYAVAHGDEAVQLKIEQLRALITGGKSAFGQTVTQQAQSSPRNLALLDTATISRAQEILDPKTLNRQIFGTIMKAWQINLGPEDTWPKAMLTAASRLGKNTASTRFANILSRVLHDFRTDYQLTPALNLALLVMDQVPKFSAEAEKIRQTMVSGIPDGAAQAGLHFIQDPATLAIPIWGGQAVARGFTGPLVRLARLSGMSTQELTALYEVSHLISEATGFVATSRILHEPSGQSFGGELAGSISFFAGLRLFSAAGQALARYLPRTELGKTLASLLADTFSITGLASMEGVQEAAGIMPETSGSITERLIRATFLHFTLKGLNEIVSPETMGENYASLKRDSELMIQRLIDLAEAVSDRLVPAMAGSGRDTKTKNIMRAEGARDGEGKTEDQRMIDLVAKMLAQLKRGEETKQSLLETQATLELEKARSTQLEAEKTDLEARIRNLEAEIETAKNNSSPADKAQIEGLQAEMEAVRSELADKNHELETAQATIENQSQTIRTLEHQRAEQQNQLAELGRRNAIIVTEIMEAISGLKIAQAMFTPAMLDLMPKLEAPVQKIAAEIARLEKLLEVLRAVPESGPDTKGPGPNAANDPEPDKEAKPDNDAKPPVDPKENADEPAPTKIGKTGESREEIARKRAEALKAIKFNGKILAEIRAELALIDPELATKLDARCNTFTDLTDLQRELGDLARTVGQPHLAPHSLLPIIIFINTPNEMKQAKRYVQAKEKFDIFTAQIRNILKLAPETAIDEAIIATVLKDIERAPDLARTKDAKVNQDVNDAIVKRLILDHLPQAYPNEYLEHMTTILGADSSELVQWKRCAHYFYAILPKSLTEAFLKAASPGEEMATMILAIGSLNIDTAQFDPREYTPDKIGADYLKPAAESRLKIIRRFHRALAEQKLGTENIAQIKQSPEFLKWLFDQITTHFKTATAMNDDRARQAVEAFLGDKAHLIQDSLSTEIKRAQELATNYDLNTKEHPFHKVFGEVMKRVKKLWLSMKGSVKTGSGWHETLESKRSFLRLAELFPQLEWCLKNSSTKELMTAAIKSALHDPNHLASLLGLVLDVVDKRLNYQELEKILKEVQEHQTQYGARVAKVNFYEMLREIYAKNRTGISGDPSGYIAERIFVLECAKAGMIVESIPRDWALSQKGADFIVTVILKDGTRRVELWEVKRINGSTTKKPAKALIDDIMRKVQEASAQIESSAVRQWSRGKSKNVAIFLPIIWRDVAESHEAKNLLKDRLKTMPGYNVKIYYIGTPPPSPTIVAPGSGGTPGRPPRPAPRPPLPPAPPPAPSSSASAPPANPAGRRTPPARVVPTPTETTGKTEARQQLEAKLASANLGIEVDALDKNSPKSGDFMPWRDNYVDQLRAEFSALPQAMQDRLGDYFESVVSAMAGEQPVGGESEVIKLAERLHEWHLKMQGLLRLISQSKTYFDAIDKLANLAQGSESVVSKKIREILADISSEFPNPINAGNLNQVLASLRQSLTSLESFIAKFEPLRDSLNQAESMPQLAQIYTAFELTSLSNSLKELDPALAKVRGAKNLATLIVTVGELTDKMKAVQTGVKATLDSSLKIIEGAIPAEMGTINQALTDRDHEILGVYLDEARDKLSGLIAGMRPAVLGHLKEVGNLSAKGQPALSERLKPSSSPEEYIALLAAIRVIITRIVDHNQLMDQIKTQDPRQSNNKIKTWKLQMLATGDIGAYIVFVEKIRGELEPLRSKESRDYGKEAESLYAARLGIRRLVAKLETVKLTSSNVREALLHIWEDMNQDDRFKAYRDDLGAIKLQGAVLHEVHQQKVIKILKDYLEAGGKLDHHHQTGAPHSFINWLEIKQPDLIVGNKLTLFS